MNEVLVGLFVCIFLYFFGRAFIPDETHKPIKQELIKKEE